MNFALILFCLLVLSGAIWMADVFVFAKRRAADAKDPWWVEYGASFFPVILLVFGLRSLPYYTGFCIDDLDVKSVVD